MFYEYDENDDRRECSNGEYPNITLILQKDITYTIDIGDKYFIENNMINTIIIHDYNNINDINNIRIWYIKNIICDDVKYEYVKKFDGYFVDSEYVNSNTIHQKNY